MEGGGINIVYLLCFSFLIISLIHDVILGLNGLYHLWVNGINGQCIRMSFHVTPFQVLVEVISFKKHHDNGISLKCLETHSL